jgi:four helix bundle protein
VRRTPAGYAFVLFCHAAHHFGTTLAAGDAIFSAMASGVRDLKVWQEAVALGGEVLRVVRQIARRETKSAMDLITLTALAVASHIAEGYGRYTVPEQRQLYRAAKRDLLRLETQLAILRHADLLSVSTHGDLLKRLQNVARLLAGYIVYLERQRTTEDEDATPPKSTVGAAASS